jgi:hypothetical protein
MYCNGKLALLLLSAAYPLIATDLGLKRGYLLHLASIGDASEKDHLVITAVSVTIRVTEKEIVRAVAVGQSFRKKERIIVDACNDSASQLLVRTMDARCRDINKWSEGEVAKNWARLFAILSPSGRSALDSHFRNVFCPNVSSAPLISR